jgi:cephalosporin hydroxylase
VNALDRWCETHGGTASARWEFEEVISRARATGIKTVVEVGSHRGASIAIWIEEFEPELAIAVEQEVSERTDVLRGMPGVTPIFGSSTDALTLAKVFEALDGRPIDFLYIDGDHEYEQVRSDFSLYSSLCATDAFVVFDDAYTEFGVRKVTALLGGDLIYGGGDSGGKFIHLLD